jgi:hypothetical protein
MAPNNGLRHRDTGRDVSDGAAAAPRRYGFGSIGTDPASPSASSSMAAAPSSPA